MVYRTVGRLFVAALILCFLTGCDSRKKSLDDPRAVCAVDYPPVLTREELAVTPPRLKLWTGQTKRVLEVNDCPKNK